MNAYIIEAKRTALAKAHPEKGLFKDVRSDELLAHLFKYFSENVISADLIDDIYIGCVGQHLEQGKNIARLSSLLANYPFHIPGTTINRLCGSSLQALNFAANTIEAGKADLILAGGVEHMDHVPIGAAVNYHPALLNSGEFPFTQMGLTAEKLAEQFEISRSEQDEFSLNSHEKAVNSEKRGFFKNEIIPVKTPETLVNSDQGPRKDSSLESLSALKAVFKEGGSVTAGNSSQLSVGASLVALTSEEFAIKHGFKPKARVLDYTVVGVDPHMMGIGPVHAIKNLLEKQKLDINDIDVFEINEAFSSQILACQKELKITAEKLNPNGGAIALGHPLGCTGTRLITTLVNTLVSDDKKFGIASMCVGHGQGMATLIERLPQ